jgi:hypothetical protein
MNVAALPCERRIGLSPSDLLAIRAGVFCPFCEVRFKVRSGFMGHLIVEHWCERDLALAWWLDLTSDRPQQLVSFCPIHLEVY